MMMRVTFQSPFDVKVGSDVMDDKGNRVGQVLEARMAEDSDEPYVDRNGMSLDRRYVITADVEDYAVEGKLQCFQTPLG